jgi:hypothetical protein
MSWVSRTKRLRYYLALAGLALQFILSLDVRSKRFWRPLIGVIVAYAVAAQSLLIALGGFSLPANVGDDAPAFELCLHDAQDAPELPAGNPDHTSYTHCIFCFAGSHHAVIRAAPLVFDRVHVETVDAPRVADRQHLPRLPAYSIASPRGPPFDA